MSIKEEAIRRREMAGNEQDQGSYNAAALYGFAQGAEYALEHIFEAIVDRLPSLDEATESDAFFTNGEEILSADEAKLNALADMLDSMGYTSVTGFYEPVPEGETEDGLTGLFYLSVD